MYSLAVEIDPEIAEAYARSFNVSFCLRSDDPMLSNALSCFGPSPHSNLLFVGDVSCLQWIKMLPWNSHTVCTISSPCPPWSRASDKDGLNDPAGRALIEAIATLRIVRPKVVVMENVETIRQHPHFQGILDCLRWSGFSLAWESVEDLRDVSPVSRKRWLAVFLQTNSQSDVIQGQGFIAMPPCSLGAFKALIPLPDEHEKALTLTQEVLAMYSNPKFATRGLSLKRCLNTDDELCDHILQQRLRGPSSFLATFVAQYGNQHNLPISALEKRGLFAELFQGRFGVRFFSPCEIAILHGVCVALCLPLQHAHLIVGNCIATQHALLAMVKGLSLCDRTFAIHRTVLNEISLLSRLHAENSEVWIEGDFLWISPKVEPNLTQTGISAWIDESISVVTEPESAGDEMVSPLHASEDAIESTLSFTCSFQVFCAWEGIQHVLHTDGTMSLLEVLETHGMHDTANMIATCPMGKVIDPHALVESDLHITLHKASMQASDLCLNGSTWIVCKAGQTIDGMKNELLGTLNFLQVVAWNQSLWPVNPFSVCDSDTLFFLTLNDPESQTPVLCDFADAKSFYKDVGFGLPVENLPQVKVLPGSIELCTPNEDARHDCCTLTDWMIHALTKVLTATDWEWVACSDHETKCLGYFQPKSFAAAPTHAIVHAVLRFLFEISMARFSKSFGKHVTLKFNGLLFWCGQLDGSLEIKQLGHVVHTVLACVGQLVPSWIFLARRVHMEGVLDDFPPNSRDNVSFNLVGPMHGGGGKTDTWKEAKSLLGKELITKGWPVRGLDDVTTKWIREIGTNKVFGILKQPDAMKRWNSLVDAAKWHGIQVEPDEPVRLKAIQKIQQAIRKKAPQSLSATGFQLVPGFFVDMNNSAVKVLGAVTLQSSGICLIEWEDALPWLQKGDSLVADELAILTLFSEKIPDGLPAPSVVTFPALDVHDRKVILRGHLWQLGEKQIKMATHEQKIDMEDSIVLAFTVWRDECKEEQWKDACKSLVKFAFACFDANMQEATIQVWGRSFRDLKGRVEPSQASSAQFHCRVLSSFCDQILKQSGSGPVYVTPKSESNLSHPDWGMIWLKDKIELELAASRATEHSGYARTKDRFALRVRTQLLEQISKEVRPSDPPKHVIPVNLMFKIQPLPKGIVLDQVVKWAEALDWKIRIIKKLGHDAVLVGSTSHPQHEHMTMNGPRQPQRSVNTAAQATSSADPIGDPWAGYKPTQAMTKASVPASQATGTNATANAPARQVDAPIAAKFTAIEGRLALFESNLKEMRGEQQAVAAAMENAAKHSVATETRVKAIEGTLQNINGQMQNAIEKAISKGLDCQEKRLDSKFQSLLDMLSKGGSSSAPKRTKEDEDGDTNMDSPLKPPSKK
eukprot:s3127_g6.t1